MSTARRVCLVFGALLVAGCTTTAKPLVLLPEPVLQRIDRSELQCLDERTYRALVARELEWRSAWMQCKAVVDELADSPRPSVIDLVPAP